MKPLLVLPALAALAAFTPAPTAYADHVCIYSQGRPVACTAHLDPIISTEELCLTSGGRPVACV